jgi:hypothetical protein
MSNTFWLNDITILWDSDYIKQIWPTNEMDTELKINAISRMIILLTIISSVLTLSVRFLSLGILSLCATIIIYKYNKKNNTSFAEGYSEYNPDPIKKTPIPYKNIEHLYKKKDATNPFNNVLVGTTYKDDDNTCKPAPPAYNKVVNDNIIENTKEMIQTLNPDIDNINDKLHGNLVDDLKFEQSLRPFYSTPNTCISNDQDTFIKYLYGDTSSFKNNHFKKTNDSISNNSNNEYTLF